MPETYGLQDMATDMMDKRETVARAIATALLGDGKHWKTYVFEADAAIAALEPAPSPRVEELKELVRDLIQGARRDRSIITPRLGPLHVIETQVTKGQVLRAIDLLKTK